MKIRQSQIYSRRAQDFVYITFWVITSDYLMKGGDNMEFFKKRTETNLTGKLMRDALITEAREQKELYVDTTMRIIN